MAELGYLQDAPKLLELGRPWSGLGGDAAAFAIAKACATGRHLIVVDHEDRAERMLEALRFFHPRPGSVVGFPADDVKPYDGFSPDSERPRRRMVTLRRVARGRPLIVVASARALLQRVPDRATRDGGTTTLEVGDERDRKALILALTHAGYLTTGRVQGPGSFAVRGDVMDVWPVGLRKPVRVDWFDDEIEDIRHLDPATHRPAGSLSRVVIMPAREERIDGPALDRLHRELGRLVAEQDRGVTLRRRVYEELKDGVRFSAIEDWLPALVPTESPLESLADLNALAWLPNDVAAAARDFEESAKRRWLALEGDERPLVPPHERFAPAGLLLDYLELAHAIHGISGDPNAIDFQAATVEGYHVRGSELAPVVARLNNLADQGVRVGLVVEGDKRAKRLLDLMEPHGLYPKSCTDPLDLKRNQISLLMGNLSRGFVCVESGWAFIPVSALFGGGARQAAKRARLHTLFEAGVTDMAQLKEDDLVVHRLHGIGKFLGLRKLPVHGVEQDFVRLEYRGGDLLFLPVTALAQLSRYTPAKSDAKVKLDKLGGVTWEARKGKVRDSLLGMAESLLRLYAKRENAVREPLDPPGTMYRSFEAAFPHTETVDQANAIEAVLADFEQPWPMDRLVCGDVGFGKTEVSMRAAMRVIEGGRQVAVLCPTTVLAFQHFHTFEERFEEFPVTVAMLSRFNTPAEEKRIIAGLRDGSIDVVVGTTAVLGRRVRFNNLGLFIVDEEHRFGVKQKDRLKRMRSEVDILSMSATPIPRTLRMALSGLREMSMIATPPADRLAVRTNVAQLSEQRVRDAIALELARGGQAYFIHNRVETIHRMAQRLQRWVPEARFVVAHGQMSDAELEDKLVDFIERRADVLVSTSIVESGVDLPNVNTMIIDRADNFGLSQLYQLRGRVGRSDVRATCILGVPENVSSGARKRLRVLVEHTRLGSGFHIAAADLELRGGGNLLGSAQSGNIDKVGYETWVGLLKEAVANARGDLDREQIEPEVEVAVPAFIPDNLVKDPHERLAWYRKISAPDHPDAVDHVLDDFEALVGALPAEVRNLGGMVATTLLCRTWGVTRCRWLKVRVIFYLHEASRMTEKVVSRLVRIHPRRFAAKQDGDVRQVEIRFTPREAEHPFRYLRWVFAQVAREEA